MSEVVRRSFVLLEDQVGHVFVWMDEGHPARLSEYRVPASGSANRSIDLIALAELMLAARATGDVEDRAVAVARIFGISRLRRDARQRVELAIEKAIQQ